MQFLKTNKKIIIISTTAFLVGMCLGFLIGFSAGRHNDFNNKKNMMESYRGEGKNEGRYMKMESRGGYNF